MFGILSGNVSIRKNFDVNNVSKEDLIDNPLKYKEITTEVVGYDNKTKYNKVIMYEYEKCILGEGQFFGENSIINKRPRNANAIALGEAEVIQLKDEYFRICFGV